MFNGKWQKKKQNPKPPKGKKGLYWLRRLECVGTKIGWVIAGSRSQMVMSVFSFTSLALPPPPTPAPRWLHSRTGFPFLAAQKFRDYLSSVEMPISVPGATLLSSLSNISGEILIGQAKITCPSVNQSLWPWEAWPTLSGQALAKYPPWVGCGWGQLPSNHMGWNLVNI